ncbi:MAG: hypothetical protein HN380_01160 [Victivallales bacterium]|nr:hypothetical protein [Victivallales bacterium]
MVVICAAVACLLLMRGMPEWKRRSDIREAASAIAFRDIDKLGELLACGLSPDSLIAEGTWRERTLLMAAAEKGSPEVIKMLCLHGANPLRTGARGNGVLFPILNTEHRTVRHWQCFSYLVRLPGVPTQQYASGIEPLGWAICLRLPDGYISELLENGADANGMSVDGEKHLFTVSGTRPMFDQDESSIIRIVELLVQHGADMNWLSMEGQTAVDAAHLSGLPSVEEFLLGKGGKARHDLGSSGEE